MKIMTELTIDIKPSGIESGIVYAPFDKGLAVLQENGLELISLPQNAQLRMQQGKDSYVSKNGNWTREGVIYIPNSTPKLVRNSPILQSAKGATDAHRNDKEFYIAQEQLEQSLTDSIDFPEENIEIPTKRFGSEALTVYAFGGEKQAQAYGKFLKDAGISKMPVLVVDKNYVNEQTRPFARQAWFRYLDYWSCLLGDCGLLLSGGSRVRGVRLVSGEASAQKISGTQNSELYTIKNLKDALNSIGITDGIERTIFEALKRKN